MSTSSKDENLQQGSIIKGKWQGRAYCVQGVLGEGANGRVYMVTSGRSRLALKIGFDPIDLQGEIHALRSLQSGLLVDADDMVRQGEVISFYVMRYIEGMNLRSYIRSQGTDWLYVLGQGLLRRLMDVHGKGHTFGDLKADNVIVREYGELELIDYGGVTPFGRSVRQFTELYDRGYWNAGSRKADAGYDLFAFAVLFIQLTDPQRRLRDTASTLPQQRSPEHLMELAATIPACKPVLNVLHNAIHGRYRSSAEAHADWRTAVSRITYHAPKKASGLWVHSVFAASLIICSAVLYIALH